MAGEEVEGRQDNDEAGQGKNNAKLQVAIREPAAESIADGHADAIGHEHHPDEALVHAGDLGHGPRNIGIDGEHAAKANHAHDDGEPHLAVFERSKFGADIGLLHLRHVRHQEEQRNGGDDAQGHDDEVGRLPAQRGAEGLGGRYTNHRGDGQAHAHISHGLAAAAGRCHGCGGKVSYGEISAVRHARDEAREHEDRVIRCQDREQVAHHEEPNEQQD